MGSARAHHGDSRAAGPATRVEADGGGYTVLTGEHAQSHVSLTDPTVLAFDYMRRIARVIDATAPGRPLRVVHIGGGGLSLARYVAAARPGSRQTVLEPDADLTELVRHELPLPRGADIRVRPVDGRTGLAQLAAAAQRRADPVDVLVVDAYAGDELVLDVLTAEEQQQGRGLLGPEGVWVANVVDVAPFRTARRVIAGTREVFSDVAVGVESATWAGRRRGNLVVAAASALPSGRRETGGLLGGAADYRTFTGAVLSDALGGGRPLRDDCLPWGP